ncbi:hypothetical protein [Jiella pacifica]|uniref:Oxidoreductase molybdopterin-binding domain-containing protein n=1 Tax=Jiella pacifica TaxID=2696469 RepID=A0A6N9T1R7_9HYPH|nr:hypothetical protein [Jiella pacifica]NDW05121.1 hypothetical protein [Jiella pacifica]
MNRRTVLLAISAAVAHPLSSVVAHATENFDDPAARLVSVTAGGRTMTFSRNDLAALPQTRFETKAPWIATPAVFEGPSVAALLRAFAPEATFERAEIGALDDYMVAAEVPRLVADGAIFAIRQDGAFMPVAQKGPVLVIFPFDDRPELQDKSHFGLCIWQISQIRLS